MKIYVTLSKVMGKIVAIALTETGNEVAIRVCSTEAIAKRAIEKDIKKQFDDPEIIYRGYIDPEGL